jgi:uncharacterized protein
MLWRREIMDTNHSDRFTRFLPTADGTPARNYICAAYRQFFTHIDEPMRVMSAELRARRAPSNVMAYLARKEEASRAPSAV